MGGIILLAFMLIIENDDERDKITKIYKLYSGTMLYVANSILHNIHNAEDAVSEAFLKIIKNLKKINPIDCSRTRRFIIIIVRNVALDILRKQRQSQTIPLEDYNENLAYDELNYNNVTAKEACDKIIACINRLNKNYSDILNLKIEFDYSNEEIGKILGISTGNVKMRLSRARKALMVELKKEAHLD